MAVIKLIGPGTTAEGRFAIFAVALDEQLGNTLAAGNFIDITLDSAGLTATESTDFARLMAADLQAADSSKISLSNLSTNSVTGAVSLRITNISAASLPGGTALLSFALATKEGATSDTDYTVSVATSNPADSVSGAATLTTTIGYLQFRILNWGSSVGNRTIDTTSSFFVPENDAERFARGVDASSLIVGGRYQIQTAGTTDWTTVGAADNNPGTIFVATRGGTGTGRAGLSLPSNLAGKNDYGLGFNTLIDVTSGDGTFTLGINGLKLSSGWKLYTPPTVTTPAGQFELGGKYTIATVGGTDFTQIGAPNNNIGTTFIATNNGSNNGGGTATSDGSDYLEAIGYLPGVLNGGVYINALDLSTLRLGNGNDVFSVIGTGITQAVRADVNIDSSFGYIFQSSIFAGSGDDTLNVLMPWQSTFKGGTNTVYYDAIFGSNPGNGIGLTLSNALTLEEVPYGDLIELKGSRFDWDIEFKDGNNDGNVTLDSILDERDYIAVANNNQISGFEKIRFGDIFFDLILYRQQQSSIVYGQPEYYLNGLENLAPELNSDLASGSQLWEAFRFNRTKLQGITGTASDPTIAYTGDANDTPFISGALRFASLNTEAGNDIVEIGTSGQTAVDQASINLGSGTDQLKVNGLFTRSSVSGGEDADNIILSNVANSTVDGGGGDDIVEVTSSVSQTAFIGGTGNDVLILPNTYALYLLSSSQTGSIITFSDGFGNSITGFEIIKFSDINLDALQQLSLSGSTTIEEGSTANYIISLNGGAGLTVGDSVAFSLQLSGQGSNPANIFTDLAALSVNSLQGAAGIVLKNISVDSTTGLIKGVATATSNLGAGSSIATLAVPVNADLNTETTESFQVTLRDFGSLSAATQQVSTAITNVPPVTIKLSGPNSAVTEGTNASFKVSLDGAGLPVGRSITITLDSASGTAIESSDFTGLVFGDLTSTLSLGTPVTDPASGAVTITITNNSGADLSSTADLLTFNLRANVDTTIEGNESFNVSLSSSTAIVSTGIATATIADLMVTPQIKIIGIELVAEGGTASYVVVLDGTDIAVNQSFSFSLDTDVTGPITAATAIQKGIRYKITDLGIGSGAGTTDFTLLGAVSNTVGTIFTATDNFNAVVTGGGGNAANLSSAGTEGIDFNALFAAAFSEAAGITLSAVSTDFTSKKVTLTVTNTSGSPLNSGREIVTLSVNTIQDFLVEGNEAFIITVDKVDNSVKLGANNVIATTIVDDDATPRISLIGQNGDGGSVAEGSASSYAVILEGNALKAGQSFSFSLDTSSASATEGLDFTPLLASNIQAAFGITLSAISTDPVSKKVTLTATNTSGVSLNAGSQIVTFNVATTQDLAIETGGESFKVTLADATGTTLGNTINSTLITDDDGTAKIQLIGESSVAEGSSAAYAVALNGTAFAAGQSMVLTLDSVSGSAKEGFDFSALIPDALKPGNGIALSDFSNDPLTKAVSLTLTNSSSKALASNAQLLSFVIATIQDTAIENDETFAITLTSSDATVGNGFAFTTISDDDVKPTIRLTGEAKVTEGAAANYAVVLEGGGLSPGQSVTVILDTATASALEGKDFSALVAANLQAALGISLDAISTDPGTKAVKMTLTNNSSTQTLAAGSQLLTFAIPIIEDTLNEGDENFAVTITAASDATVANTAPFLTTITDDDQPIIRLSGSSKVGEPGTAIYSVRLAAADILAIGQALTFVLGTTSATATEELDFFPLLASAIKASKGLTLLSTSTDPNSQAVTLTVINDSGVALPGGSELVSFTVMTRGDFMPEPDETFLVSLTSATVPLGDATVTTTIQDEDELVLKLAGSVGVVEGSRASYGVYLDGRGLGNGRKVTLTIDATGITATEGVDFLKQLLAAQLRAAAGLTLTVSLPTRTPQTVTVTNTSGSDLPPGSALLSFSIPTTVDLTSEGNETFAVNIISSTTRISSGTVTTAISDYGTTPSNPGFIVNTSGTSTATPSGAEKPKSILGTEFGTVEFETEDKTDSAAAKSSLAKVTASVPLRQEAIALLNRYQVSGSSGSRPASDPSTTVLQLNLNVGSTGYASLADITLATEVKATASLHINSATGDAKDNTYDPNTGLGVELLDTNNNSLVDTLRVHLQDGASGDDDGSSNGRIQTSLLLANAPRSTVYRFYNQRSGVHFYTPDEGERDNVILNSYGAGTSYEKLKANPASIDPLTGGWGYSFEGIAYQALETQGTALYRFYNASKGYHFLSTSAEEANNVIKNSLGAGFDLNNAINKDPITGGWGYKYEGTTYKVSTIAQHGMDQAVYRFYNVNKGVHFYTASSDERDNVIRNSVGGSYVGQLDQARNAELLSSGWGYSYEGIGWYV